MPEPTTMLGALKTTFEVIATTWKRGALLLWSCAAAAAVAFVVLLAATHFGVHSAFELNAAYAIYLLLTALVLSVFALFKTYSERQARPLKLIANVRRSMWGQARQPSGQTLTTFSLHLQATNVSDGGVNISDARLVWPWVSRKSILDVVVLTEASNDITFSSQNSIPPHALRQVAVNIVIDHPVGRPGKRLNVTIKVQDHSRNWYWLTFSHLRSAPVLPPPATRAAQ